jgi:hypothetical protein
MAKTNTLKSSEKNKNSENKKKSNKKKSYGNGKENKNKNNNLFSCDKIYNPYYSPSTSNKYNNFEYDSDRNNRNDTTSSLW